MDRSMAEQLPLLHLCQWGTGDVSAQALEFVALAGTDSNRRMQ